MNWLHRRPSIVESGSRRGSSRVAGQANVELALVMMTLLIPLSMGVVALGEIAWTYHALVTLTRQGARYAATHCFQDDAGSNVVNWMQNNAPPFIDRPQLISGGVQILVNYWSNDLPNQASNPFSCGAACTPQCVPDAVTVSISGYQFRHLLTLLGLQPLSVPPFSTTVEVQSAGGDPELSNSTP